MISVLTLTYKRYHILEEAIQSYLSQDFKGPSEMVIINDHPEVVYELDHPNIRVINCSQRFGSVGEKLSWGYKQCTYDYIYRLDDDDLLAPWALTMTAQDINTHPGYEIYRSKAHYFFQNNEFIKTVDNINNGNVYTKAYLDRITFPKKSGDEDAIITYHNNARIYNSEQDRCSMIYRWGMNTYHISGFGIQPTEVILSGTDKLVEDEQGVIKLLPQFKNDYYNQIK